MERTCRLAQADFSGRFNCRTARRCKSKSACESRFVSRWRSPRMRLSTRSYPHPVVGNRDDVPGAAFQAIVEVTADKQTVYLDVSINSSSLTVNQLIKEK